MPRGVEFTAFKVDHAAGGPPFKLTPGGNIGSGHGMVRLRLTRGAALEGDCRYGVDA